MKKTKKCYVCGKPFIVEIGSIYEESVVCKDCNNCIDEDDYLSYLESLKELREQMRGE